MSTHKWYLIVPADGTKPRVVSAKQRLRLNYNECAFELSVRIPDSWGRVVGQIGVTLPDATSSAKLDDSAIQPPPPEQE